MRKEGIQAARNDAVSARQVAKALFDATAKSCEEEPVVYVAVDGTSLTFFRPVNTHLNKDSRFWLDALSLCEERMRALAPKSRAWYQLDPGADCWLVVKLALKKKRLNTVRSVPDRLLLMPGGSNGYLRDTLTLRELQVTTRPRFPLVRAVPLRSNCRTRLPDCTDIPATDEFTKLEIDAES